MATPTNYIQKIKGTDNTVYDIWDANAVHDVDSAFSDTSTNPVQNKLVTKYKQNALDIGSVGLTTTSEPYLGTLSSDVMTEFNTHLIYNGQDLIFSSTINSQTVVFRVSQTGAKIVSSNEYMIFSGTYGVPGTGADWQTKMCTVTINLTAASIAVYPITVAVTSHTHGDIDNSGAITTNPGTTIASGDALLIADSSLGNAIKKSATTFGTSTTTYLRNDGTWGTPAGTDTKVTQTAITGTSTTSLYPLLLVYGTGQTATTTNTANFTANASVSPSGDLYVNKATSSTTFNYGANAYTQYNATLKAIEFCFA